MSSNIWAVLNDVSDDTDKPKLKKKPVNAKKGGNQANQKTNQTAAGGKPQLTDKAARAFRDGQKPKQAKPQQPKKVAPQPAKSPVAASSSSSSAAAAAPAKQQGPAIVVKKPAAAPAPVQAPAPQGVPQKAQNFVKALNQVLNGQAAFFQVSLMRSSEVGVLQSNPYRVVGDMVKSPQFVTNLGLALKKDAKEFAKKDVRAKILGRVNRIGLAHHLLALLSGHSPVSRSKTDEEATRLVTGFLEALWNITPPAEPVKRVEVDRVQEADEEDEMIGSAGNVKRDAVTLSDFITIKPAKVKGGKKGGKPQPPAQQTGKGKEKVDAPAPVAQAQPAAAPAPAPAAASSPKVEAAAAQPQAQVPEGKKDDPTSWRADLVDSAKQLSRRIPANIQCVRVEPAFLWSAEEVKASGKQQPHYFKGQGCDHCYAFWEDGKGDIYFLITNGSA